MQINITASKNRSKFVILNVQYTIIALVWGEHRKLLTDGDFFFPRALARGNNLEGWQLNVHLVDENKGNEPSIVEFYTWSTQTLNTSFNSRQWCNG